MFQAVCRSPDRQAVGIRQVERHSPACRSVSSDGVPVTVPRVTDRLAAQLNIDAPDVCLRPLYSSRDSKHDTIAPNGVNATPVDIVTQAAIGVCVMMARRVALRAGCDLSFTLHLLKHMTSSRYRRPVYGPLRTAFTQPPEKCRPEHSAADCPLPVCALTDRLRFTSRVFISTADTIAPMA